MKQVVTFTLELLYLRKSLIKDHARLNQKIKYELKYKMHANFMILYGSTYKINPAYDIERISFIQYNLSAVNKKLINLP